MVNEDSSPETVQERLEHASGDWEGCYYPAGAQDVIKALTQQTGEYMESIVAIKEQNLRVTPAQLQRTLDEWRELDANIKFHKIQVIENDQARHENRFQQYFEQLQEFFTVQANATLGDISDEMVMRCILPGETFAERYKILDAESKQIMELKEHFVIPQIEIYTQNARELYTAWIEKADRTADPKMHRYAWFTWMLKRRASLI